METTTILGACGRPSDKTWGWRARRRALLGTAALALCACGGGGTGSGPAGKSGPAPLAQRQSVQFETLEAQWIVGQTVRVKASASSGLRVSYSSATSDVCLPKSHGSDEIELKAAGTCTIVARQSGTRAWAGARAQRSFMVRPDPVQSIRFEPASNTSLTVPDTATVRAQATSGLPVRYSSLTPVACSVDADNGLVRALAEGTCTVAADQAGDAYYKKAPQVTLSMNVLPQPLVVSVPGKPQGVTLSAAGSTLKQVTMQASHVPAGGSPITGYTVTSSPAGITVNSATLPVTVNCPNNSCAGYAFVLTARNAVGLGQASEALDLLVRYKVHQIHREPDYLHIDTEFRGSFTFNASKKTVSALQGDLSEVMAGTDKPGLPWPMGMPLLHLKHQLVSQPDVGGLLVGTFLLPNTLTLSTDPRDNGEPNGWRPDYGAWKYYGYANGDRTHPNPGNAYVLVYVNTTDPTLPLASGQIDRLAYADCADAGMMGDDCMTGTTVAGYGTIGSMRGYPISQVIQRITP